MFHLFILLIGAFVHNTVNLVTHWVVKHQCTRLAHHYILIRLQWGTLEVCLLFLYFQVLNKVSNLSHHWFLSAWLHLYCFFISQAEGFAVERMHLFLSAKHYLDFLLWYSQKGMAMFIFYHQYWRCVIRPVFNHFSILLLEMNCYG
jgi:hypothetical protein